MKRKAAISGFTLIEILVVISIIAILAGMIIPTFYYAKSQARAATAKAEVKNLEMAFKAYLDTYKVWPAGFADGEIKDDMFKAMRGENAGGMNPQLIPFYEFKNATNDVSWQAAAYDPWSKPNWTAEDGTDFEPKAYRVLFDHDYNNAIDALPDVYRSVVVYSVGEAVNGARTDELGGGNDVASWK